MNPDLLRQRRNLILISLALLLSNAASLSIEKISIFGTEISVGNAPNFQACAWVVWFYFLIRYYQYLRQEGDLQIIKTAKSNFDAHSFAYVMRKIDKGALTGRIIVKCRRFGWNYSVMEGGEQPWDGAETETFSGRIPMARATLWWLDGLTHLLVHTPKGTDHVLPFFIAALAPLASLFF
ncbi:hypothetical protein [Aquabacterium sp.]|uniref:hypothetical protein n=1 Tax=Aquabacterium sp. TaxID=1872578 RepID=UPI003D0606E8